MSQSKAKIIRYVAIAILGLGFTAFYAQFIYHLAFATWIDTDYANLVLEANDIVNGNVFLAGWNQTGVSFLLTDIIYFVVGVMVCGLSKSAYIVAISLMFLCTLISTFFLTEYKSFKNCLLFFALTLFPTVQVFELLRAHTGGFVLTYLIFIIIDRAQKKEIIKKTWVVLMVLFVAMIAMSDAASLLFGAFSIAIICLFKLVFDSKASKKFYGKLLVIMLGGTVLGTVMDKLYYIVGGANKNSFLGSQSIIQINSLVDKLYTYFDAVFVLGHANVFYSNIFTLKTIVNALYFPVVLIGFYLTFKNISLFIKHKNEDLISVAISIGFVLVSLSFIFTTVGVDIYSSRYFATLPFFFAVLICRYVAKNNLMDKNVYTSKIKLKYVVLAFSVVALAGSYIVCSKNLKKEFISEQEGITGILAENNLTNGYGSYWDASVPSLTSEGKVNVRQITIDGDTAKPLIWFCKDDWYKQEAQFVIMHDPEAAGYGVTEENVLKAFGKPSRVIKYDAYLIYIYSTDISQKLAAGK